MALSRNELAETIRADDERQQYILNRARRATLKVLILVLVGGFFYEIAHKAILGPFTCLCSLSRAAFILSTIYFRHKI